MPAPTEFSIQEILNRIFNPATNRIDVGLANITGSITFTSGVAVVAGDYSAGRDADATNQLHFNVPTGASFEFSGNDVSRLVLTAAGLLLLGDTTHAGMTVGLVLNQGANDDMILSLKSSDVAHAIDTAGWEANTETDDFCVMLKVSPTLGGLRLSVYAEDAVLATAFQIGVMGGRAATVKTTASEALVQFYVSQHDGLGARANIADDGNVFGVSARVAGSLVQRFMVDEDGDIFTVTVIDVANAGPANVARATAFDEYDDVALVRAFERSRKAEGLVISQWDDFVVYHEDDLVRLGVLGAPVAEGGMWNLTQHTRLLNGAVWQLYTKLRETVGRLEVAEATLKALPDGG